MAKILFFLLSLIALSGAHRILVVFPFPSKSHSILGDGIVRHLLNADNHVTYITPFPWKNPPSKLSQVDVSSTLTDFKGDEILNLTGILQKKAKINDMSFIVQMMLERTKQTLEHANVEKVLLDRSQKFDAVIAEWMFSDIYAGLAQLFECPYILFTPFEHNTLVLSIIDEHPNPAYTPGGVHLPHLPPFDFKGRVMELFLQIRDKLFKRIFFHDLEVALYDATIKPILEKLGKPIHSYVEARDNISLALINTHVSMGYAARLPWNYLPIGGYHIDTDVKPLPKDLQTLMDNAKHGVIYFSMGSNLKSKLMPDELKNSLLKMFSTLKQTVLWKFEENLPNLPSNVKILQWAPQPSILAHPNCVVFITHGGLLSTTETIHFGVPVIGIPVFADQFLNVDRAVVRGYAKRVDLAYTMADDLKIAIEEMLMNPKYKEKVKELSFIYHHRPIHPGKLLAHGVEHVILTKGAPHLRSPAFLTPWYQKMYLDLAAIIVAALYIVKVLIRKLLASCGKKKVVKKDNIKKKN